MSSRLTRPTAASGVRVEVVVEEEIKRMMMKQPRYMLRYLKPTTMRRMRAACP